MEHLEEQDVIWISWAENHILVKKLGDGDDTVLIQMEFHSVGGDGLVRQGW